MRTTTPLPGWRSLRQFFPALLLLLLPLLVRGQSPNIVISQVYGAGGNVGATYNQDYVELFNRSPVSQAIGGYTVQYGAPDPTGVTNFAVASVIPSGTTIAAGGYYLIGLSTGANGNPLPASPNFTPSTSLNLGAASGKVALVNGTTPLLSTSSATGPTVIDFIGYGTISGTNKVATYEGGSPAPTLSTTSAAFRGNGGCTDANQNGADFTTAAPSPRNASTSRPLCADPVLVANPSALTFAAPTGQVATVATYRLTGFNLNPNALITVSSTNPAVAVSTTGAAGIFASSVTVSASAAGALMQTISVQFTAPTAVGTISAAINNTDGTRTASVAVTGTAITAYTWNGNSAGNSSSYNTAANWTPARTTPTTMDVLVFDGAQTPTATVTLDFASPQTIGQLQFVNNVVATLSTDGNRTLTLDNNMSGDDFVIRAGSTVTIANSTAVGSSGLDILLTNSETGIIGGTLIFTGYLTAPNGRHTLQATGNEAIQFLSGSLFQATTSYSSTSPFGAAMANAGTVVFRNGARYEQYGGSNPFGLAAPNSVAAFEPSSIFLFGVAAAPSLGGRTYGTLIYDVSGTSTASSTTGTLSVQGDLLVRNGNVSISGSGSIAVQGNTQVTNAASLTLGSTGGIAFQGNVQVNDAATLAFASASAATVQLNGSTNQVLGGTSTAATPIAFGPNATLQINNAAGVTLGLPITVPGTLQLINGQLTTTVARSLTLPATAAVLYTAGSNASFVNGPVIRPLSAPGTYIFPIGKGTAFRPFTLNIAASNNTTYYYRAEQFEGNPGQNVAGSTLKRVSSIRSFTVTPFASATDAVSPTGVATQPPAASFSGTATLSFGSDDGVTNPAQLVVAKRPDASSAWTNAGASNSSAGTVTSASFNSFSDFALGSTDPITTNSPLPVTLTSFGATRQVSGAVQVRWATASEQRSAYFEVQRSLDGSLFTLVDKVAAQGTTTQAHPYASLDAAAPASQLYYRLRQVDTDGTNTFSPVVTLAATEAATSPSLYPNPAHNYLTVSLAAGEEVQILDLTGRMLQKSNLPASGQLSVEALSAGTYLLRVSAGGQPRVLRFTKE